MRLFFWVGLALVACGGSDGDSKSLSKGSGGGTADGSTDTGGASASGGSGNMCNAGEETCPCYGNGTCNAGLVCASNLCVNVGANSGGAGNGGAGAGGAITSGGTAAAGGTTSSGGTSSNGGTGGAPQCLQTNAPCSGNPNACCLGLLCVVDDRSPSNGTCGKLCQTGSDCSTGCCAPVDNGTSYVCAPSQYCAPTCLGVGASCLADPYGCCAGSTCAYDDPSNTTASCAANCTFDSDCVSYCCAPITNGPNVCSDPVYCGTSSCLPVGTRPCGLGTPCCPGSYCTSDAINQICLQTCTVNSDCATGCCATPNGNGVHVCTDPGYCGF